MTSFPADLTDAIHLWQIDLGNVPEGAVDVLGDDEQDRAARFHFAADRRKFVGCRTALRILLAGYLGDDPRQVQLHYGPAGKPGVQIDEEHELFFNVSHSGETALIAVTAVGPVGVDVERVRTLNNLYALAAKVLSPGERDALRDLPEALHELAFFTAWVRKESLLKALGLGLGADLQAVSITVDPREPPRVLAIPAHFPPHWRMWSIDAGPGYEACVSLPTEQSDVAVRHYHYDPSMLNRYAAQSGNPPPETGEQ